MLREKIIALSLGAVCAAVGGVLVLKGVLPGLKPATAPQQIQSEAPRAPAPAKLAAIPAAPLPKPKPLVPQFDTVRVEPSGDTVIAGHGEPEAKITLLAGQTILGDTKADDGGDFVIVPQPLAPGNYVLTLSSISAGAAAVVSQQSITVSVPAKGQTGVVVALVQPGKPSQLLTDPTAGKQQQTASTPQPQTSNAAASAQKPGASAQADAKPSSEASAQADVPRVAIKTAEVDKGAFYAAGFAAAGTHLRIYLNGSALADVTAGADGAWSLTIGKGVTAGHYVVRADAVGENGKVAARAEVPFDVPVAVAQEATPKPTANASATANPNASANAGAGTLGPHGATVASNAPAQQDQRDQKVQSNGNPAADTSHAVVTQIDTATVTRGDSLWRISQRELGEGVRYTLIYKVNASQIRDPNLIYPGQVFVMPHTN